MATMRQAVARLHRGLAWLAMAGWLAELYLIGAALFGVTSIEMHRMLGYGLAGLVLLLLVLALAGRLGRRAVGLSALLLLFTIVQGMLPSLRMAAPWAAALHSVNALTLMGLTAAIGRAPRAAPRAEVGATDATRVGGAERLSAATAPR